MSEMKILNINGESYEIVDEVARNAAVISESTATALGLTDATVDEALVKLSEATLAKQVKELDKVYLQDWEEITFDGYVPYRITYGAGKFVATCNNVSNAMYSEDGINWNIVDIPKAGGSSITGGNGLVYGGGKFVSLNYNQLCHSEDGINWISETILSSNHNKNWISIAYGNGKYVATSAGGTNYCMYSEDGINWTLYSGPSTNEATVAFGNGVFVMGIANGGLYYSEDGVNWTKGTGGAGGMGNVKVAFGGGRFVAIVGDDCSYSDDGINWNVITLPFAGNWSDICYTGTEFVVIHATDARDLRSSDGINWVEFNPTRVRGLQYGVAGANGILIYTSYVSSTGGFFTTRNTYNTVLDLTDTHDVSLLGPLAEALGGVKIDTGTYTGTGKQGVNNKNSLTFSFVPKLLMIWPVPMSNTNVMNIICPPILISNGYFITYWSYVENADVPAYINASGYNNTLNMSWNPLTISGTTVSWYSKSTATEQLDTSGRVFSYMAIG